MEDHRAAGREAQGEGVLDENEARIQPVLKARPQEAGRIVEQPVDERRDEGEADQLRRDGEARAEAQNDARARRQQQHGDDIADVERRPHFRFAAPGLARIEAQGREPDPVEQGDLDRQPERHGDGEAPEFLGAEEARDDQADQEIEQRVDEQRREHPHGDAAAPERRTGAGQTGSAPAGGRFPGRPKADPVAPRFRGNDRPGRPESGMAGGPPRRGHAPGTRAGTKCRGAIRPVYSRANKEIFRRGADLRVTFPNRHLPRRRSFSYKRAPRSSGCEFLMPWNDQGPWKPGNSGPRNNGQSPWGRPPSGPPDLEDMIRRGQDRIRSALPGGMGGRGALALVLVGALVWLGSGFYTVATNQVGLNLIFGEIHRQDEGGSELQPSLSDRLGDQARRDRLQRDRRRLRDARRRRARRSTCRKKA